MKKISLLLAISALIIFLSLTVDASVLFGDNNFDGKVDVSDARLALRAAINLEDWGSDSTDKRFIVSDVNSDNKISVEDARLILRCAIGLGKINKTEEVSQFDAIGISEFNNRVNVLKQSSEKYMYSGCTKTQYSCGTASYSGVLAGTMKLLFNKELKEMQAVSTDYSDINQNRMLTNSNYSVPGCDYVSSLSENDIEKAEICKVNIIDFGNDFRGNINSTKDVNYDLSFLDVPSGSYEKITVTLRKESINADSSHPVYKVFGNEPKNVLNSLKTIFSDLENSSEKVICDYPAKAGGTVTYWFDATSSQPVAAQYNLDMTVDFSMKLPGSKMSVPFNFNIISVYVFQPLG